MAKFRITGPDGARYDIDAPNDEAAEMAVQQMFGDGGSPTPAPPTSAAQGEDLNLPVPGSDMKPMVEPSLVDKIIGGADYALDTASIAADDAIVGGLNLLGLPVDAINASPMLANLIPGVDGVGPISHKPVGGSQTLEDLYRVGGLIEDKQPQDGFQAAIGRTAEEMGAALVPGAGAVKIGEKIGVGALRQMPRFNLKDPGTWAQGVTRLFAEPAAVDPAKFLAKEQSVAMGAGVGASAANEVTGNRDGANPWVDAAGAVSGALATGLGSGLARSGRDIFRALTGSPEFADDVVKDAVMRDIARSAGIDAPAGEDPDLTRLIMQAESGPRVDSAIPGFKESLADRTQNTGLAAREYGRQTGPNSGAYIQRNVENTQAVDNAMSAIEPTEQPGAFSGAMSQERDRQLAEAAATTGKAQDAFSRATENLMPALTAESRGANIRTALEDASDNAKEILSEAWAPINDSRAGVNIEPLAAGFDAADAGLSVAERQRFRPAEASIPKSFIDPENPETAIQSLNEVTGIRSALTDAQREAASAGRSNEARVIGQYIDRVDDYMGSNLPSDLMEQYDSAKAATKDFNDRFSRPQTAVAQTLSKREGLPRYPDSSTTNKFVQDDRGRISDFEDMMREAGSDDRVRTAVRDQVLQDVKSRGLLEKPEALEQYLGQYGTVFKQFPDLKQELGTAGVLRKQLADAQGSETALRDMLTKENRSTVAKYLTYGDENADRAMQGVLSAKEPSKAIDELLTFVGDEPKAVEGARKAFWGILQTKSRAGGRTTAPMNSGQPWSATALKKFLDDPSNAAVAERLYRGKPEHLNNLRGIAEVLQGVDMRNTMRAPNASGTGQAMNELLTPEALQSRLYAYFTGRVGAPFLITSIASVVARRSVRKAQEEGIQRMLDDVLLNPDSAAILMKENNPANRRALAAKAKLWFGNEASTILNAMSADDEGDETDQAVMRTEEQ